MLNKIWFWLLCIGILYGFAKASWHNATAPLTPDEAAVVEPAADDAPTEAVDEDSATGPVGLSTMGKRLNAAVLDAAQTSVTICIGLVGIMALWLGLLNIAKDAGLVEAFTRLLRPLMRWLFPDIPDGHPAQGAMLMNMSANMLGLDNAATPMGLKAMRELQELNAVKDTATDSMAMFLAINTSSVTLVPFTIIGYRALSGSVDPAGPMAGMLLATTASTVVAVIAARWLARLPRYRITTSGDAGGTQ